MLRWRRRNFDNHNIIYGQDPTWLASQTLPALQAEVGSIQNTLGVERMWRSVAFFSLGLQLPKGLWCVWPCVLSKSYGRRLKGLTLVSEQVCEYAICLRQHFQRLLRMGLHLGWLKERLHFSRRGVVQEVYFQHRFVGPEPETLLNSTQMWWVKSSKSLHTRAVTVEAWQPEKIKACARNSKCHATEAKFVAFLVFRIP